MISEKYELNEVIETNCEVNKELYEIFHKDTSAKKKIPKERDFSLRNHINMYKKYLIKDKKVLDIGCGSGEMSIYTANKGCLVKGVDLSEKAISENKKSIELLKMNNLCFESDNFMEYKDEENYDIVILSEVLEHLPNDEKSLQKIYNLLRKDGYLLMSVPSKNAPLHKKYIKKYGKDPFDERVGHLRRYDAPTILNLLHKTGFELIEFKLCEGYLRNWLFNDKIGQIFMKFNRLFITRIVSFLDDNIFLPLCGESDIIVVVKKQTIN